jgi:hypothetical protein
MGLSAVSWGCSWWGAVLARKKAWATSSDGSSSGGSPDGVETEREVESVSPLSQAVVETYSLRTTQSTLCLA